MGQSRKPQMRYGKLVELLDVSRPLGVKLLSGERKLTVDHIAKLASHFKVSPDLFIGVAQK